MTYKCPTNKMLKVTSPLKARRIKSCQSKKAYMKIINGSIGHKGQGDYKEINDHK